MNDNTLYLDKTKKQIIMAALDNYRFYIADKLKETNDPFYSMLASETNRLYWTLKTQIKED